MNVYTNVPKKQLQNGIRIELKEHPWLGKKNAQRLVLNHLNEHPYMYRK